MNGEKQCLQISIIATYSFYHVTSNKINYAVKDTKPDLEDTHSQTGSNWGGTKDLVTHSLLKLYQEDWRRHYESGRQKCWKQEYHKPFNILRCLLVTWRTTPQTTKNADKDWTGEAAWPVGKNQNKGTSKDKKIHIHSCGAALHRLWRCPKPSNGLGHRN